MKQKKLVETRVKPVAKVARSKCGLECKEELRDCQRDTAWEVFFVSSIDDHEISFLYMKFCGDNVCETKTENIP